MLWKNGVRIKREKMRLEPDRDFRISSSCGIIGIMSQKGERFNGEMIIDSIATMRERANGLGGGFAAYGIYPEYKDFWCFHLLYDTENAKSLTEDYLEKFYNIEKDESIPTRKINGIKERHLLWRYFLKTRINADNRNPRISADKNQRESASNEEDFILDTVMYINTKIKGAFVVSSGKNMGIFKGVGYPEDIGRFYRLEEYSGYIWTAHRDLYKYGKNTIVQCASGRFGVDVEYLEAGAAIEIKIGQGAKPGIGGHLPGEKVSEEISQTRMIPVGTDALSPAPHHDIYSIEDLRQLIYALKEATRYKKPVGVKIACVHNVAPIASGIVRAGADFVAIDGIRGGTGAAPTVIRDNVGIPIELAIAVVDQRLREEGIRHLASIIAAGGIRLSSDIIKAIALGADAVYIGTAALVAMGCHVCQKCYTGKCNWGIATQDPYLTKRLNPDIGTKRLVNLLHAWSLEIKEMLGGMGINAIESLRGNREQLRGVGLSDTDLKLLGIKPAGEAW